MHDQQQTSSLPSRVYERHGVRTYSIGYKRPNGTWAFRLSCHISDQAEIAALREEAIHRATGNQQDCLHSKTFSTVARHWLNWQKNLPRDSAEKRANSTLAENEREVAQLIRAFGRRKVTALTPAQKQRAISDQVRFFDQECEGINFLAGEYQMRQKIEIPPGDDLNDWNPGGETDGNGQCSMQTITIPPEYQENSCYQTTALEKRECFDVANVNVYMKPGLPDKDKYVVVNANTPTWKLTFHPAQHNITVYGIGYEKDWICVEGHP